MESLNHFLALGLPNGNLTFREVLTHLHKRQTQLILNEGAFNDTGESRNRTSRELTVKRSIRYRGAKKIKAIKIVPKGDVLYDEAKASLRAWGLTLGKTHSDMGSYTKQAFDDWFDSFKGVLKTC